jgi:ribonuclease BN (tRNA processing enzyme)
MNRRRLLATGGASLFASGASPPTKSRLILLGTAGGPTPKPNRAAPASAVVVGDAVYVIDCGNGVARQMVLAGLKLEAMRGVFVTHHHSDHNADYGNLLWLAWAAGLAHPVDTYGPPPLKRMTELFREMNAEDIAVREADEGRAPFAGVVRPHEITGAGPVMADANVKVTAAVVAHPMVKIALAYRFDCPDRSIVFSGDTTASDALVTLARGADVLVHEVMYLPALERLVAAEPNAATLRRHLLDSHSTGEQVGRAATAAGVKTLVLNHFVPGGLPTITDDAWRAAVSPWFKGEIVVGLDLMEL